MKKQLLLEAKRILLPLIVFTVITSALYLITALNSDFIFIRYYYPNGNYSHVPIAYNSPGNPLTYIPAGFLAVLSFIVPVLQYSYRMKKRATDLWYSLPITRTKLVLLRTLGGLALVLIPYTFSYWLGFAAIALSENMFRLSAYVPLFFASIGVGILLYGVNSFLYTRANLIGDGIIFMLAWITVPCLPFLFFLVKNGSFLPQGSLLANPSLCLSLSPLGWLFAYFDPIIRGKESVIPHAWFIFGLGTVAGAAAFFGLFFTAKRHKAENAGQISDTFFGYKTLIPWSMFFLIITFLSPQSPDSMAYLITILIFGLIAYFIYRRSFRLKKYDILSLIFTLLTGIAVSSLHEYVILPLLS